MYLRLLRRHRVAPPTGEVSSAGISIGGRQMKPLVAALTVLAILGALFVLSAAAKDDDRSSTGSLRFGPAEAKELTVEFTKIAGKEPLRLDKCKVQVHSDWILIEEGRDTVICIPKEVVKQVTVRQR